MLEAMPEPMSHHELPGVGEIGDVFLRHHTEREHPFQHFFHILSRTYSRDSGTNG